MGNHTHRVILTSAYLRAVRGQNLSKGESPIKLAVQWLQQMQGTRQKNLDESDASYLDAHKQVMRETTRKAVKRRKKEHSKNQQELKKENLIFAELLIFLKHMSGANCGCRCF